MSTKDSQIRATAFRHAQSFEEKKVLRNRVADLVVELFDIPAEKTQIQPTLDLFEAILFKQGLNLFQLSDFDDLVTERNIDDRCGYGLCPRPNIKIHGGQTVWNGRGGKNFSLVPKAELEKWCSKECGERALFVRAQLSKEPAWNRDSAGDGIRLLDEVQQAQLKSNQDAAATKAISESLQSMTLDNGARGLTKGDLADRLHELALERGELKVEDTSDQVSLKENVTTVPPKAPVLDAKEDMIEGYRPSNVRFGENREESSDEDMSDVADGMHYDPDA